MVDTEKGKGRRGRGRPPKLTARHKNTLRELALANPRTSLEALTALFVEMSGVEVAASTVRAALKAMGVDRARIKRC